MARDLATLAEEYEGRFLAGLVDIDASPRSRRPCSSRPSPTCSRSSTAVRRRCSRTSLPLDDLRGAINQVMQQLTAQGVTGRHQPRAGGAPRPTRTTATSRRSTRATPPPQDALGEPTTSTARSRSTRSSSTPTPPTPRRPPAWPWRSCSSAPRASTSTRPRGRGRPSPDDVDAQTLVADLDMLGGHVDDAFDRLVELVRRSAGDERNQAREHLLGLFAAVGNDDPRVLKGRQALASALF